MKATVQTKDGVTVVSFEGFLDFEYNQLIKQALQKLYKDHKTKKFIFNLGKLAFVGSSGLKDFIVTLANLNRKRVKPRLYGLRSEYLRLLEVYGGKKRFLLFEDESTAKQSFNGKKKKKHPRRIEKRRANA